MSYHNAEVILSLSDHKQAVLYFDNVIPIEYYPSEYASVSLGRELLALKDSISLDVPIDILPEEFRSVEKKKKFDTEFAQIVSGAEQVMEYMMMRPGEEVWCETVVSDVVNPLKKLIEATIIRNCNIPVLLPKKYRVFSGYEASNNNASYVALTMDMVNTEYLTWDHIVDFKSDADSLNKLRRFRRFLHENYEGKSRSFIEDDIYLRIDDYHASCKKHGFSLVTTSIGQILESKTFLTSGAAAIAAVMMGESNIAPLIASSGVGLELGKMCLKMSNIHYNHKQQMRKHDISYLIELQNLEINLANK